MINYIFREYLDVFVIIYLDDIFIYLRILKDYKEYIYKVF
jgi:hypothetical protein